jgi:hypothetical protein
MERTSLESDAEERVEVFLHEPGKEPVGIQVGSQDTFEAVLEQARALGRQVDVFVGEPEDDFEGESSQDEEDHHDPVSLSDTLASVGVLRHCHLHICHCRRVAVELFYQEKTLRRRFSPGTTVARVIRWARKRLNLNDADADRLVLQVPDSKQQPRLNQHLGELVHHHLCSLCFNLVHDIRVEG